MPAEVTVACADLVAYLGEWLDWTTGSIGLGCKVPVQRGGVRCWCFDILLSWMTDKTLSADSYRRQPLLKAGTHYPCSRHGPCSRSTFLTPVAVLKKALHDSAFFPHGPWTWAGFKRSLPVFTGLNPWTRVVCTGLYCHCRLSLPPRGLHAMSCRLQPNKFIYGEVVN